MARGACGGAAKREKKIKMKRKVKAGPLNGEQGELEEETYPYLCKHGLAGQ